MKLTKKVELGVKAVDALKSKGGPARVQDLAVEIGTTVNFLEQIMRLLRKNNIVSVKRGPGGGYFLLSGSSVTALQVAEALGGNFGTFTLDATTPTNRLNKAIVEAFQNTTI